VLNSRDCFFDTWIFGSCLDYRFYRIPGGATAAGAEVKAEAPGSVINEFFDRTRRNVIRQKVTMPKTRIVHGQHRKKDS
jgi:hypothetical protein